MKKRQAMALILAAALAVPNTGVVPGMIGMPVAVEAAAPANVVSKISFSPAVAVSDNAVAVQKAIGTSTQVVIQTAGIGTVGDAVSLSNGWTLLNSSDKLVRGKENKAKVRYTFAENAKVTGNGWEKTTDGTFYGDFTVTFEVAEEIDPVKVLEETTWPTLTDKVYDANKDTQKDYWNEDLKSGSSPYGTFSVDETAVSGADASGVTVPVTLKLNPGYVFKPGNTSSTDVIDGVSINANDTEYVRNVKVKVNKQVISNIKWPEVKAQDGQTIVYGADAATALGLAFDSNAAGTETVTSADGLVDFSLVKTDGTPVVGTLANGSNDFRIHAEPADSTNYIIAENNQNKDVKVNAAAPTMTEVKIQYGAGDTEVENGTVKCAENDTDVDLKAVDNWNYTFTSPAKDDLYALEYQWYKGSTKIPGATSATYNVAKANAGEYYCEVSAKLNTSATIAQGGIFKDQPVKRTQKVNVVFSDIDQTGTTVDYNNGSSYTPADYGNLETDVKYTVGIDGLSDKAAMTLIVKDSSGKEITSSMISGKASAITAGACDFVITVNKSADAGSYTFLIKVKDGNNTVFLDPGITCTINKQTLTIDPTLIRPTNKELIHGDGFDKLAGFEYAAANTATTDEKRAAKAVNDKIKLSVKNNADWANGGSGFGGGYFVCSTNKTPLVTVELTGDTNKKNYKLGGVSGTDDKGTVAVTVPVEAKKITLGVDSLEMVEGESLPERIITGMEFKEADRITVTENGWTLYEKDDKNRTPIKNGVKSLKAGKYSLAVNVTANGTGASNYKINSDTAGVFTGDINTELTIYAAKHTVGFVTYGDTEIADAPVNHGDKLVKPADPTRAGYKFVGWYADKNLTNAYDFAKAVTGDFNLYAKWEKVPATDPTPGEDQKPGQTPGGDQKPGEDQKPEQKPGEDKKPEQKPGEDKKPEQKPSPVKKGTTAKTKAGTFVVTNASKKTVAYKSSSKSAKKVTVPSSIKINGVSYKVTKIENNAFKNRTKLTKVTIPSTVTEIGTAAFKGCKKLTSVTIPKNVTKIGKEAFSGCKKLKTITIKSKKIKSVGKNAFKGIASKSVIKTPKGKKTAYKKILKKAGYKKTVK